MIIKLAKRGEQMVKKLTEIAMDKSAPELNDVLRSPKYGKFVKRIAGLNMDPSSREFKIINAKVADNVKKLGN